MATLESLPGEILYHIATMCRPPAYYNFALAYRRLYEISHGHYKLLYIQVRRGFNTEYECLPDGTRHGAFIERYFCNPKLIIRRSYYRNGLLHGFQTNRLDTGYIYEESYAYGKLHGERRVFNNSRIMVHKKTYDMGRQTHATYYSDGMWKDTVKYKKNGCEVHYDVNGIAIYKVK